jgi:hypothetical protein
MKFDNAIERILQRRRVVKNVGHAFSVTVLGKQERYAVSMTYENSLLPLC